MLLFLFLLLAQGGALANQSDTVDLPSFLESLTQLRNKLITLLGSISHENSPTNQDLIGDSVFEDKEKEKEELFQHVHAMPANLGNGENDQDHQEFYEDYYYEDYEFEVGRKSSDTKVCKCAKNHNILDTSNRRIVGGSIAIPNSLPWQAFIRIKKEYRCGGSILNKRFVLSAMHCFHDFVDLDKPGNDVVIGAGIHDLCVNPKIASQFWQLSHVKKIHHPGNYDPASFDNDIAILELQKDFILNDVVQPVCLPSKKYSSGEHCFVSGWGHDANKQTPCELQYVGVPILDQEVCKTSLLGQEYKKQIKRDLPQVQICAGHLEGGKDACQGDSGGPLVAIGPNGKVEIVGIVSWGIDCAQKDAPGAYTNVFEFLDFIKATIEPGRCKPRKKTTMSAYQSTPSSNTMNSSIDFSSVGYDMTKCSYQSWAGNGFCDDPVNTIECGFDLGDCCPSGNSTEWKQYCQECLCKEPQ